MEKLFNQAELHGEYLEAFKSVAEELELKESKREEAYNLAFMLQTLTEVSTTPLKQEVEAVTKKAEVYKEELRYSKISMNALEEENRRLTIENLNLLNCLKAFRDLHAKEDKIKGSINHPDYLDFIRWLELQKQEEAVK